MWLFLAVANVSTWKVTKGKLIYFIHIAMASDFMYGVPPRHTHGENREASLEDTFDDWCIKADTF